MPNYQNPQTGPECSRMRISVGNSPKWEKEAGASRSETLLTWSVVVGALPRLCPCVGRHSAFVTPHGAEKWCAGEWKGAVFQHAGQRWGEGRRLCRLEGQRRDGRPGRAAAAMRTAARAPPGWRTASSGGRPCTRGARRMLHRSLQGLGARHVATPGSMPRPAHPPEVQTPKHSCCMLYEMWCDPASLVYAS